MARNEDDDNSSMATCLEPNQRLYQMIVENPRPDKEWSCPRTETPQNMKECDRILRVIEEGIEYRRGTEVFVPAYNFFLDYIRDGVTNEDRVGDILALRPILGHIVDMLDVEAILPAGVVDVDRPTLDDQVADILGGERAVSADEGGSMPVYFVCLFENSVEFLLKFYNLLTSMDTKIQGVLRFLRHTVSKYEMATVKYRDSASFLCMSSRDRRNYSRETSKSINEYRSMIRGCKETLTIKYRLISRSSYALETVYGNLPQEIPRDSAIRALKMRDFVYHSLHAYEEYLSETVWRIRLACEEMVIMEDMAIYP